MSRIPQPSDMHVLLARQGDPTAFLSLFGSRLSATRAALCAGGTSPEQAATEVLELASRLYRECDALSGQTSPDEWFVQQVTRLAPKLATVPTGESRPSDDSSGFLSRLELHLQRLYSSSRRAVREGRAPRASTLKALRQPWVQIAVVLVALCTVAAVALVATSTGVELLFTRDGRTVRVALPTGPLSTPVPAPTVLPPAPRDTISVVSDTAPRVPAAATPSPQPLRAAPVPRPAPAAGVQPTAPAVAAPRPAAAPAPRPRPTAPAGSNASVTPSAPATPVSAPSSRPAEPVAQPPAPAPIQPAEVAEPDTN